MGVDALLVASIEDPSDLDHDARREALDLAQHLNLPLPQDLKNRRVLVIEEGGRSRAIIVGEHVRIEKVEADKIQPLPPFLGALSELAGFDAVFRLDDDLGFVISAVKLVSIGRNGGEV